MSKKSMWLGVVIILAVVGGAYWWLHGGLCAGADITGWEKLKWGATQQEAAAAYALEPWSDSSGVASCSLAQGLDLGGVHFRVFLYFTEKSPQGKLREVLMMGDGPAAKLTTLPQVLKGRYGPWSSEEAIPPMISHTWQRPSGKMVLNIMQAPAESNFSLDEADGPKDQEEEAHCSIQFLAGS